MPRNRSLCLSRSIFKLRGPEGRIAPEQGHLGGRHIGSFPTFTMLSGLRTLHHRLAVHGAHTYPQVSQMTALGSLRVTLSFRGGSSISSFPLPRELRRLMVLMFSRLKARSGRLSIFV